MGATHSRDQQTIFYEVTPERHGSADCRDQVDADVLKLPPVVAIYDSVNNLYALGIVGCYHDDSRERHYGQSHDSRHCDQDNCSEHGEDIPSAHPGEESDGCDHDKCVRHDLNRKIMWLEDVAGLMQEPDVDDVGNLSETESRQSDDDKKNCASHWCHSPFDSIQMIWINCLT